MISILISFKHRRNTEQQSPSEDELSRASDTDSQQIDVNDSDADMPLSLTTGSVTQSEVIF